MISLSSLKTHFLGTLAGAVLLTGATASAATVAHYRFEDGLDGAAATGAVDSSGAGNDMNVLMSGGGASPVHSSDVPVSTIVSSQEANGLSVDFAGSAVAFEGTDNEGLSNVQFDNITIELWINFSNPDNWQTFVGRDDRNNETGGDSPFFQFQNTAGGQFRAWWYDRNQVGSDVVGFTPAADTWYHVAVVGDSTADTMTLFVDGLEVARRDGFPGLHIPATPSSWTIGRGQWGGNKVDWINARIDEVRFSDSALSPSEFLNFDPSLFSVVEQPEDVVAWLGEDVEFSTEVNSAAPYTFQWEVSTDNGATWSAIDGATSATYSLQDAALSSDRNQYRAAVTREDGFDLVTEAATLRVGDADAPTPANVVAHYRFEEGAAGGTATGAIDSSGNGHDLANAMIAPVYATSTPSAVLPQTGESNALALDFRGGNHAIQGADGDSLSQVEWDDFTIEAWVNFAQITGWQTIIGRDDRGDQNADGEALIYFQKADWNAFRFVAWGIGGVRHGIDSNFAFTADTWTHLAAVGDTESGTITLYADGVPVGSTGGYQGLLRATPDTHWTIGRGQYGGDTGAGDYVNGQIDEVRFTAAALSPTEFLGFSNAALNFAFQPADVEAAAGDQAEFNAVAGGGGLGALTYQWQVSEDDGETWSDILDATGGSYAIDFLTISQDGNQYRAVASRDGDSVSSAAATLSVSGYPDPEIVRGLGAGQLAFAGSEFSLTVEATGVGELTYQWSHGNTQLVGEVSATLNLDVVADSGGTYSVTIKDNAALDEGLDSTSVTLSTELTVVQRPAEAISLNFVGASGDNNIRPAFSRAPGVIDPNDAAGAVAVANWNNSPSGRIATQTTPFPLMNDYGEATSATATWASGNTWGARVQAGTLAEKDADQRLFHGYIESRTNSTATISGIPYATYDVYVYPVGVEGAPGEFIRSITLEDADGAQTTLYGRNYGGNNPVPPIPFHMATATTEQEAVDSSATATFFRFGGVSGSSVTVTHADVVGGNLGGIGAISIVNTTEGTPSRPFITSRPSGSFQPAGSAATFSVSAESVNQGGSLSYQWEKNGVPIPDATSATLTIENASSSDTGDYTVVLTDTSDLGSSVNAVSAPLVVVDSARPALISADINWGFTPEDTSVDYNMDGHGILRSDGPVTVDPNNPREDFGAGTTQWNALDEGLLSPTYAGLVDAAGYDLPGVTFSASGATGIEEDGTGGGIFFPATDESAPLLRDYIFTQSEDVMTMTVGGLDAFAGREVTLVVYAIGKESTEWPDGDNVESEQNDVATVTLAAQNSPTGEAQSGVTNQFEGRDLAFNNQAQVVFNAVVPLNGTVTWTVGSVLDEPGLNAFNGFQLLVTDLGEPPVLTAIQAWRQTYFETFDDTGDAALTADPDGDGLVNLIEYALGTNPKLSGDGLGAVEMGEAGGFLTLAFNHIDDASLVYQIEASVDLEAWAVVQTYPSFTVIGQETYVDTVSVDGPGRRFLRLSITLNE